MYCVLANDSPTLRGSALKTPTALAPTELASAQQPVPMKRTASSGAVAVDDIHQRSASHQLSAVKQPISANAGDLRYRKIGD